MQKIVKAGFPDHLKGDKDKYIKSIKKIFLKRKATSQSVKVKIKRLFKSKNVIKIPVSFEIFINAYQRVLSGRKPSKSEYCPECDRFINRIDSDCLIFKSILSRNEDLKDNELIFCSGNKKDFASHDEKAKKHILHPDLRTSFPKSLNVRYYLYLAEALNQEFKTDIERIELDKAKSYQDHIAELIYKPIKIDFTTVSQTLKATLQDYAKAIEAMTLPKSAWTDALRNLQTPYLWTPKPPVPPWADYLVQPQTDEEEKEEVSEPEKEEGKKKGNKKKK